MLPHLDRPSLAAAYQRKMLDLTTDLTIGYALNTQSARLDELAALTEEFMFRMALSLSRGRQGTAAVMLGMDRNLFHRRLVARGIDAWAYRDPSKE